MNNNEEKQQAQAQTMKLSPQFVGSQWASEAVREILAKPPEQAQFELHALQFMALNILSNEAYNVAIGFGEVSTNNTPKVFSELKMKQIIKIFAQHIQNGVVQLRSLANQGKLTKLESKEEHQEESDIILTNVNEGDKNEKSHQDN